MALTKHFIELAGQRIAFAVRGEGKRNVLCLPGALGSLDTDFGPQLSDRPHSLSDRKFTVVSWDPPGYGLSRPPERTFPRDFFARDARVVSRLMKAQEKKRYDLVGWSDGGITALFLAHMQPERVKRLVVWGANSFIDDRDKQIYEGIRDLDKWSTKMREPFTAMYGEERFRKLWNDWVDGIIA